MWLLSARVVKCVVAYSDHCRVLCRCGKWTERTHCWILTRFNNELLYVAPQVLLLLVLLLLTPAATSLAADADADADATTTTSYYWFQRILSTLIRSSLTFLGIPISACFLQLLPPNPHASPVPCSCGSFSSCSYCSSAHYSPTANAAPAPTTTTTAPLLLPTLPS